MLRPSEQAEVEHALTTAAAELLSNAMAIKATMIKPSRIAPLAVVLSHSSTGQLVVSMVAMLDVAQRVETIREALRKTRGFAFAFLYDGFIQTDLKAKQDALLFVAGTAWGVWRASASPYEHGGMGAAFSPTIEVPEAAKSYHAVFEGMTLAAARTES